ncbi:MAG: AzlC family ABC transporter permease [Rhizobiales bacterium]|nr:AzlC family ABC transporter permease [Hyphomicrobiales bacterium]
MRREREKVLKDTFAVAETPGGGQYWEGFRSSIPVSLAAMPFGLLFGALSIQNGFTTGEAVLMSATLYAGASQMVGLELFGHRVAPWIIVLSIFAVNFRHVLYSAAVGRRIVRFTAAQKALAFFLLVDPQFAETESRAEAGKAVSFIWYMGFATPMYLLWVGEAWIGARFGNLITDPHAIGIDFMLPIYFMCLVMGFRARANWLPVVAASAVCSTVGYHIAGSPWHVTIGAAAGILVAALLAKPVEPR